MLVMILPVNGQAGKATVNANGTAVGTIEQVTPTTPWEAYDGTKRIGVRWMPTGVDPSVPGPQTPAEAALLLLALEGYDATAAIKALRLAA